MDTVKSKYDLSWVVEYIRFAIPSRKAHKTVNIAIDEFLSGLAELPPEAATVAFLVGRGEKTGGSGKQSEVVIAFTRSFDEVLSTLFPPGTQTHQELAALGCYLPISSHLFRVSEPKVLERYRDDRKEFPGLFVNLEALLLSDKQHKARDRIRWLSEVFISAEQLLSDSSDNEENLYTLRYLSEILLAISLLGTTANKPRSIIDSTRRSENSDLCDLCFRHRSEQSVFCSWHQPKSNDNDYRRLSRYIAKLPHRFERVRTKTRAINEQLLIKGVFPAYRINFREDLLRTIEGSTWEAAGKIWWEVIKTGLPNVFQNIRPDTINSDSWETTIRTIWVDLRNDDERTIDPDIAIGTLIDAECWYEMEAGYFRRGSVEKSASDKAIELLKKGGMTQKQMAQEIGCSEALISRVRKEMFN